MGKGTTCLLLPDTPATACRFSVPLVGKGTTVGDAAVVRDSAGNVLFACLSGPARDEAVAMQKETQRDLDNMNDRGE